MFRIDSDMEKEANITGPMATGLNDLRVDISDFIPWL